MTERSVGDLNSHWEELLCPVDMNDLYGNGNYDSSTAKNVMVVFEKCDQAKETAGRTGVECLPEK